MLPDLQVGFSLGSSIAANGERERKGWQGREKERTGEGGAEEREERNRDVWRGNEEIARETSYLDLNRIYAV